MLDAAIGLHAPAALAALQHQRMLKAPKNYPFAVVARNLTLMLADVLHLKVSSNTEAAPSCMMWRSYARIECCSPRDGRQLILLMIRHHLPGLISTVFITTFFNQCQTFFTDHGQYNHPEPVRNGTSIIPLRWQSRATIMTRAGQGSLCNLPHHPR